MKAKAYLQEIRKIDLEIAFKIKEVNDTIETLKLIAGSITSHNDGERVQSSGSKEKMADAVAKYVDLEEELKEYIAAKKEKKNAILETIETLPISEYELLHMVYVQGMSLKEIKYMKGCSYSAITSLHKSAKERLQEILDEREMGNA